MDVYHICAFGSERRLRIAGQVRLYKDAEWKGTGLFMFCSRRVRLSSAPVLLLSLLTVVPLWCQAPPAQQPPEQQPKPPATQQPKTNPFENVPQAEPPQQQKPAPEQAKPQLEAPKAPETAPPQSIENVVESIEFRGARRVPQDTLRALIMTKKGDIYNEDAMHVAHDDSEQGKTGIIVRYVLAERRVVRSIKYSPGMKSVSVSEVLDRFKERKVGLTVESQYDPNKVQRAAVV